MLELPTRAGAQTDLTPRVDGCRYDSAVSDLASTRPAICLNMIVRNETHIICETLDSVAPFISSWVIADTGSDDGTQDLIRQHMAALGIPGELHERPWRDFGRNRTEALELAQDHADYILVMDADDKIVGTPDFDRLDADVYLMRLSDASIVHWRAQLFRNGAPVRYVGVVHETPVWDDSSIISFLKSGYHIESRRLGARNKDPKKYERDRDLLLGEVEREPENARWVFYLAQTYFDLGDYVNARHWYARRIELGGWDQETYYAMFKLAESLKHLDETWPDVQDAYLRAWEFRPTRAEALHAIAFHYRSAEHYPLGYLFAERAAQIPLPEDFLFVTAGVYAWCAIDEQAVCAGWIGRRAEAFGLCRQLLARNDIPDADRQRIAVNRDFVVPAMIETASNYPAKIAASLTAGSSESDVTITLIAGPDRADAELAINSFLHCCQDIARVGRFLAVDIDLPPADHSYLRQRYPFIEFTGSTTDLRAHISGRYWLHLGHNWRFFAAENYITRLIAVLDAEPDVFQVAINFTDAIALTGASASEEIIHRTPDAGRYVLTNAMANGPAMIDTTRPDTAITATLDEVLCIAVTSETAA
jgi:glycosyltransferase involved in cell wall biosynthesis